jgi:flagellar L-ring protein precursor FlgH
MNPTLRTLLLILVIPLGIAGCANPLDVKPGDPDYAPVEAQAMLTSDPNDGGIYRAPGGGTRGLSLFEDTRARQIGDILTITLSERTVSSKSATSEVKKESSLGLDAGTVLGRTPTYGDYTMETAVNHSRDFSGEAAADQRNNLQGSITVMVSNVLPNGVLEVRGEKWLTLNRGEEFIRLRGLVRPDDILPDNSIPSSRIADVRITYSGTGELAESSRQGWLSRFFNSEYWPF